MRWLKVTSTVSLETGPVQADFENATRSGSARENAPLVMCPGSDTVNDASPAVEMTFALVRAVYSRSTPGTKGGNAAGPPTVSASVAGTVPPTVPGTSTAVLATDT